VNWEHFRTFLWLRARIRRNQMKRAGMLSLIITSFLAFAAIVAAVAGFAASLIVGGSVLSRVPAPILMLVWDGLFAGFLFFWMIGLLAELQRSEVLSLEKFLHLPVSLNSVFIINYISTILCPTVIVFVPAMIGLSIGLVWSRGPMMLWLFPMVAGFVLVVTALTYQFQGWLAALMVNKRRRRTVIAVATMTIMLMVQLPNLLRFMAPRRSNQRGAVTAELRYVQQQAELESAERVATIANTVIPLGWPAYGAMTSAQGNALPSVLAALGLTLIGTGSLWRSYRTTLRLYTGQFGSGKPRPAEVAAAGPPPHHAAAGDDRPAFLEKEIPWLSEQAGAIALACFRSLTRAPEAKMLLLTPVFMVVIFGSMLLRRNADPSEFLRPLYASGGIVMILFSLVQLSGNQFGFDRSGFRTFVLSSASRKDILLGKNLSVMPLAFGLGTAVIIPLQIVYRMRLDHFLAIMVQMVTMYLTFCLVANFLSILAPTPIAPGTLRPARPRGMIFLMHFLFVFLFPIALSPMLVPLGIEFLLRRWGWPASLPVYLLLTLIEAAVVLYLYPPVLALQGDMLHRREQRILEIVTSKVE